MLQVFFGKDTLAVRAAAHAFLDARPDAEVTRITADRYAENMLTEFAGVQGLFGGEQVIVLDTLSENTEALNDVLANAAPLAESSNTFVVIEGALLADQKKIFKKYGTSEEVAGTQMKEERFNTFALADAFARKDKKTLWLLFMRARVAGIAPEEIAGVLFWQIKSLRLAAITRSAQEAGMKDFPYKKAQRALTGFKAGELDGLSRKLVSLYHDGHLGKRDIDIALERFVLSL